MLIIFRSGQEGIDPLWVLIVPSIVHLVNKSGKLLLQTLLHLNMIWGITIHKSQGLTLEHAVIELGCLSFSAGLSFMAIFLVRSESETMKMSKKDNDKHSTLDFHLDTYGIDPVIMVLIIDFLHILINLIIIAQL